MAASQNQTLVHFRLATLTNDSKGGLSWNVDRPLPCYCRFTVCSSVAAALPCQRLTSIRREFTTRLNQSQYNSAILNDIDGKAGRAALAAGIDADRFGGLLPYASYVAGTVFVHTMAYNNERRGLTPAHLRYSVLSPDADLSFVSDAKAAFIPGSAYLDDHPSAPLRFNAEANITHIIAREERNVEADALRVEADSRIKDIFDGND